MKVEKRILAMVLGLGATVAAVALWKMNAPAGRSESAQEKESLFAPKPPEDVQREERKLAEEEANEVRDTVDSELELVEVSPLDVGVPEEIAIRYDQAYLYTGTAVPGSEPKPLAHPEMPAGTVTEEELRAKEARLVELYPALEKKILAARKEREKSAADYTARGMGSEEWALKNDVQLEE